MADHMKAPWPEFSIGIISAENYARAKVCVDAFGDAEDPAATMKALKDQRHKLAVALEDLMRHIPEPPKANCSCHLCSPCQDCIEFAGLRESFAFANLALARYRETNQAALKARTTEEAPCSHD